MKIFATPPNFKKRMIMMILGVIIQGLGLSLLRKLNLGTDPCSTFTLGVVNQTSISFGTAQLLCHLVTFLFVIKLDLSKIGYGTIGNMVFLGYISDFFTWIWEVMLPANFFNNLLLNCILLLPIMILFIGGASAYMTADLGMSPYDGLPFIIAERSKKVSFKIVRMIWDISFMIAGFLLGGPVGVITIVCAFFLGPVISWFQSKFMKLL